MERDLELGPLLELGNKIREKKHEATFICQSCRWIGGATEDPWLFFAIMGQGFLFSLPTLSKQGKGITSSPLNPPFVQY